MKPTPAEIVKLLLPMIDGIAKRGNDLLMLEVVEKLCTRVIVLHGGRIVADDSVSRLRDLMTGHSLEEVFTQLVLPADPEQTASAIVEVVTARA